jgi:5-methylcytosine-specific restriction protein A
MPASLPKPCGYPGGCKNVCSRRYCDEHAKQVAKQYDAARSNDPTRKLYHTRRWQLTRDAILVRDPICVECHHAATEEIDHIVPARQYGDFYDQDNLQGLCKPCHSSKTAREGGFAGNNAHE